jgi:pyruvate dehydrogenase E2 component (dihydrolipoamide acetyltransferase)
MAEKIVMLALSPTMETGTIVKWHKKVGEAIAGGDVLCEVETDKTAMDYESTVDGTLLKIIAGEGAQAKVGDPIAIAGESGEDIGSLLEEIETSAEKTPEPSPKQNPPAQKQPRAPASPEIQTTGQKPQTPLPNPQPVTGEAARDAHAPEGIKASPLARAIARDRGIDMHTIRGSGPGGRIVKRDLKGAHAAPAPNPAQAAPGLAAKTISISEKRKIIARRLSESFYSAPHYYETIVVEADSLFNARARVNAGAKEKLSFNAFIMKLVAESITHNPMINASWQGDAIVMHESVDIAIAVAQPDGLITPIVRSCESKGVATIDRELRALIDKAGQNRLTPEEYTNATFTISNLGSLGIRQFTAIINPPASAILAVGEMVKQPVVDANDAIVVRKTMAMTISCDHRILDGAVSAAFMKTLKEMIEDPIRALL